MYQDDLPYFPTDDWTDESLGWVGGNKCTVCVVSVLFIHKLAVFATNSVWSIDKGVLQVPISISNCYTMDCPPVRGDNPRALASGLSYVQVDKHVITILYHLY